MSRYFGAAVYVTEHVHLMCGRCADRLSEKRVKIYELENVTKIVMHCNLRPSDSAPVHYPLQLRRLVPSLKSLNLSVAVL